MLARHEEYCSARVSKIVQPRPLEDRLISTTQEFCAPYGRAVVVGNTSLSSCQKQPTLRLPAFWWARWSLRVSVALWECFTLLLLSLLGYPKMWVPGSGL